jgi:hypothetical protein
VQSSLHKWLDAWGYTSSPGSLHTSSDQVAPDHPYRTELNDLLDPKGNIRAKAVFDVEGIPTVCFVEKDGTTPHDDTMISVVRERAWNQNLVSIILILDQEDALAAPTSVPDADFEEIPFTEAQPFGAFSRADIQSGEVFGRHPDWFAPENRVDRKLLANLSYIVEALVIDGVDKTSAQLLMAQVMFVAYLEHRGIIGKEYWNKNNVRSLFELVNVRDRSGAAQLITKLKSDFNGDLLEPTGTHVAWTDLPESAFQHIDDFLSYVDLERRQLSFWHYDFRFIPVELISGIYESFLSQEKRAVGAYYTPRHLATLAVTQAFAGSKDILSERVYDGACGSGILLTTAFRKMLAYGEAKRGRQWTFKERIDLLVSNIFGSDINESACRVTAFSLYLSVLENLQPADIAKLTAEGNAKLPTLRGTNIFTGNEGDFFSSYNPLAAKQKATLFLSNPPWVEPDGEDVLSADEWAENAGYKIPRRQICAAFMLRALDSIHPEQGRFCFILPVSVLGAPTSQSFVRDWLERCELETVINFGDMRKLLFDNAKQPTLVVVAHPKKRQSATRPETFEYWTPKADVSLAFGRLTLHGTDRHIVRTNTLRSDNSVLTTLFWGTPQDQAAIARLEIRGQIGDLLQRKGWRTAKGFHKKDKSVETLVSTKAIENMPYLDAKRFMLAGPVLEETALYPRLPEDIQEVPNLSEDLLDSFRGPRIVFKDGMTPEREICAGFTSKAFSFNSSTGYIQAPAEEADVLRFLSVYLHSDLVRYLLLLTAYQISFERERVTLANIKRLPFVHPKDHPQPQRAAAIVEEIAAHVRLLENADVFKRRAVAENWKPAAEKLITEYFGLNAVEASRIQEVVDVVLPSVQPSSVANLITPLQERVSQSAMKQYMASLVHELNAWRDAMGGQGHFDLQVMASSKHAYGAMAAVRLDVRDSGMENNLSAEVADSAVAKLLQHMKNKHLLPVEVQDNLYLAADIVVQVESSLYLIKPLIRRLWLQGEAVRDAERIVRHVQEAAEV